MIDSMRRSGQLQEFNRIGGGGAGRGVHGIRRCDGALAARDRSRALSANRPRRCKACSKKFSDDRPALVLRYDAMIFANLNRKTVFAKLLSRRRVSQWK